MLIGSLLSTRDRDCSLNTSSRGLAGTAEAFVAKGPRIAAPSYAVIRSAPVIAWV